MVSKALILSDVGVPGDVFAGYPDHCRAPFVTRRYGRVAPQLFLLFQHSKSLSEPVLLGFYLTVPVQWVKLEQARLHMINGSSTMWADFKVDRPKPVYRRTQ